jgi:hypothetical protein
MKSSTENISPQGPLVAFDLVVETMWMGVMGTLRAAPLFDADWLVAELGVAFGYMESLAAMAGSGRAEVVRHLREMRVFAETMFPVETVSAWSPGAFKATRGERSDQVCGRARA